MLVLAGKVRLVPEEGQSTLLKRGDWLGDRLELPGIWKARAADKDVVVAVWSSDLWKALSSNDLDQFWALQRGGACPKRRTPANLPLDFPSSLG